LCTIKIYIKLRLKFKNTKDDDEIIINTKDNKIIMIKIITKLLVMVKRLEALN